MHLDLQAVVVVRFTDEGSQMLSPFLEEGQGHGDHPQGWDALHRLPFIPVEAQRGFQGGKGHLVHTQGPGERVFSAAGDDFLLSENDPCLGTAEQFVATEGHYIDPLAEDFLDRGFAGQTEGGQIHEAATSQVFHDR